MASLSSPIQGPSLLALLGWAPIKCSFPPLYQCPHSSSILFSSVIPDSQIDLANLAARVSRFHSWSFIFAFPNGRSTRSVGSE
ncbi:hypothetical protein N7495_007395 [Penicillium taxi]|uniref:uncharacterized protein n=1 Tax=Penicillium taxi TaxID=168475 RepID=UPI0025453189|nr:uncharacterized protein N7495_007395 [Penicillium taxi]KAJ5887354.1 hypothetical protein N7495_007395 [Penicillium taxi]